LNLRNCLPSVEFRSNFQYKIIQRPYLLKDELSCRDKMHHRKLHFHNDEILADMASVEFLEGCVVFLSYDELGHFTIFRFGCEAILSLCLLGSHIYRKDLELDAKRCQSSLLKHQSNFDVLPTQW